MENVSKPMNRYWEITKSTVRYILAHTFVKRWRSNYIQHPGTSHAIYINPSENRGRVLLMMNGITQPRLDHFWKRAVSAYKPSLVIDVGVNYGECLFSVSYPENCHVIGIEANLHLKKYIERTRKNHPDRALMRMIYAIASNETKQNQAFYVNKWWSGLSSAVPKHLSNHKRFEKHEVQSVTIDSILQSQPLAQQRVLFKIDVEGNEQQVLEGMVESIERCEHMLGIIEFDSKYLLNNGADLDKYLQFLQARFKVYIFLKDRELVHMQHLTFNKMQQLFNKKTIHTDIIIASPHVELPEFNVVIRELDVAK